MVKIIQNVRVENILSAVAMLRPQPKLCEFILPADK